MENTENKFKHEGVWYIAVEQDGCRNCDFCNNDEDCEAGCIDDFPACVYQHRQDNRNVIFVRSDVDNLGGEE